MTGPPSPRMDPRPAGGFGVLLVLAVGAKTVEDVDHRRRLYQTLQSFPGLHLAALAREAGVAEPLARYHMRVLVRRSLATEVEEGGFTRYYPKIESELGPREAVDRADKAALALLRRPAPLRVVLSLLGSDTGEATMSDLAREIGLAPPTTTYHVANLGRAGVVVVEKSGRERKVRLANAEHVVALLVRYPPPKDVVAGFVELWDQLEL